jgi:hypothetical protein
MKNMLFIFIIFLFLSGCQKPVSQNVDNLTPGDIVIDKLTRKKFMVERVYFDHLLVRGEDFSKYNMEYYAIYKEEK